MTGYIDIAKKLRELFDAGHDGGLCAEWNNHSGLNASYEKRRILIADLTAAFDALRAERDAARLIIWQCWNELNEIRARDGVPWTHQREPAGVSEEYFSKVVDDAARWLSQAAVPWPPKDNQP